MYCKKCGKQIDDDSNFCMYCGTIVSKISIDRDPLKAPTKFESAIFIDSIFVKQSIEESKKYFLNLREEDFSISEIISRLITYTEYDNYMIYYFEVQRNNLKPNINLDLIGKTVLLQNKPINMEIISADFLAVEMSEFYIENEKNFKKTIIIADDVIYSDYICKRGKFDNLTIFRRRESESMMQWGFYDKHGYFIDIIEEIYKEKK